jgi:hypothetical protein
MARSADRMSTMRHIYRSRGLGAADGTLPSRLDYRHRQNVVIKDVTHDWVQMKE